MDNLTVRFLRDAEKLLQKSKTLEKSFSVIHQLRLKSLDFSKCVPTEINSSEVCMHCGNAWRYGLFSLHLKCHKKNKIKKQIRKIDQKTKLSSCRRDYLSYYKSQKDNILVKKCLVCESITKYSMNKPFTKIKPTFSLPSVENESSMNRKRKRKSGKKQSFAGLSPAAVLQARLSSTKVEKTVLQGNDVSKMYEPLDFNKLSRLVEKTPLLPYISETPDKSSLSSAISKNELLLGIHEATVEKQNLKNDIITLTTKRSKKKKKKSLLTEL